MGDGGMKKWVGTGVRVEGRCGRVGWEWRWGERGGVEEDVGLGGGVRRQ